MARTSKVVVTLNHLHETTHGKHTYHAGDEITVKGQGRYRIHAIRFNGELNCWGPSAAKAQGMRTFRPEHETVKIHRPTMPLDSTIRPSKTDSSTNQTNGATP